MSPHVLPFGPVGPDHGPVAKPPRVEAQSAGFAHVVDLATRRQDVVGPPGIPDHVWDEVEAASRLWHELRAQDREVRFDTHAVPGRVMASLRDLDGGVVRALPLRNTFGFGDHGPGGPASAA